MPIRPPALDDRRFDDLVAELIERIPAHTQEWTNPRVGDPGRTLLELFAWLGDALLYRANLIPERQRLQFLRLLGKPLRPARPARGLVALNLKEKEIPAAFSLKPRATFTGPVPFEAADEITVLPVTGQFFYKRPVERASLPLGLEEALSSIHNVQGALSPYETAALFADGKPVSAGFDLIAQTADHCLWLALLAPLAPQPAQQADFKARTVAALERGAGTGQTLNLGFVPALPSVDPLAPVSASAEIPCVWEISVNTTGQQPTADRPWQPEYLRLDRVKDTTKGLTRPGIIRLALPPSGLIHAPTNNLLEDRQAGVGDHPPRLDDEAAAALLIGWIRLRPQDQTSLVSAAETRFTEHSDAGIVLPDPAGATPTLSNSLEHLRISWASVNALELEQLVTRQNQVIGESDGSADQEFQLPLTSIEPETLNIQVEEESGWSNWNRVDDIAALEWDAAIARNARVFQLDPEAGTIRFGDGVRGRIPSPGRRIRFTQLRAGGGRAGNVTPGVLAKVAAITLEGDATVGKHFTVQQPLPFSGGEDAENLAEAEKRIPGFIRHKERAVTRSDYETLAYETPGVAVGRVEILARFKPQQRHFNVPGVISVMALPDAPLSGAPNPRADRPFLEAVHSWLNDRRPLGTELYVIGCEYVPVAVSIAISVHEEYGPDTVLQEVKEALRRLLWPLRGGGFQKEGWPLGGTLSNRELAVEAARVSGVSEVNGLNLFQRVRNVWQPLGDARDGREQDLPLQPWQLPELLSVIAIASDSSPVTLAPNASPVPANAVAVPVVPPLC